MDIVEINISLSAAVIDWDDVVVALQHFQPAEATGAAAAGIVNGDAASFQSGNQRFTGLGRNGFFMNTLTDCQLEGLICHSQRISFHLGYISGLSEYFKAYAAFRNIEFLQFTFDEIVHDLRSADEVGCIFSGILFDDFGIQEAFSPFQSGLSPLST